MLVKKDEPSKKSVINILKVTKLFLNYCLSLIRMARVFLHLITILHSNDKIILIQIKIYNLCRKAIIINNIATIFTT